ncbi:MAG: hypothetical protein Q8P88_02585 [Candidatus Jorgensenbacteria bacterium]|nr:hypothetical protein [Candidatus Jorgensenbacteria bacterium]
MAIMVEEEKKKVNWITALSVAVFLAVIFFGGYYLFFKQPELIDVVAPAGLERLRVISEVRFNPRDVVDSPAFQGLDNFAGTLPAPRTGKANPFAL